MTVLCDPRSTRRRARVATACVVVGSLLALAGCGSGGQAAGGSDGKLTQVDVGILPSTASAPLVLGIKKGFFREQGLDVRTHIGKGGAAILPAVVSGQYEIGFSNNVSLVIALSKGLPIRIVAMADSAGQDDQPSPEAVVVAEDSPIKSLKDLEGKRVATNTLNNIVQLAVMAALEKEGVDPSTVKFVEVGFPEMPLALKRGEVEAADIVTPFLEETRANGGRPLAEAYRELEPDLFVSSWFTTQQQMEQKKEVVEGFAAAMNKANQYAESRPDEVRQVVPTYLKITDETAQKMTLYHWSPQRPSQELLKKLADYSVRYGFIDSVPDVSQLLPPLQNASK